jgi:shikimate dehydrogenase
MDQYVVIGNPIEHSRSPVIHHQFASQTQQQLNYQKQLVELGQFEQFIAKFKADGGKGCNVTVPFKELAFKLADQLSARAQAAGAVNTLIFEDDGTIVGDNTDGQGLVGDILANNIAIKGRRVLLIGAGGAARGCILPLLGQEPSCLTITNRSFDKAQLLAETFRESGNINAVALASLTNDFDIIINSTSASLSNQLPNIDPKVIAASQCCYDMAYGSEETCFLTWTRELGVSKQLDGLGMLVGQAAESFRLWRGVTPETQRVLDNLRASL